MARLFGIVRAAGLAHRRRQGSLASIGGNNVFIMSLLLLQRSGGFVYLLIGLALLFPLSTDAWERVPVERRGIWPVTAREKGWLRIAALALNPVAWLAVAAAVMALLALGVSWGIAGLVLSILAAGFAVPRIPNANPARWLRAGFAPSWTKVWRELLVTLDFYCAATLSLGGLLFQLTSGRLPDEGRSAMTMLLGVVLSSFAACRLGFDGDGAIRYRLWPVPGWRILLDKGLPYTVAAALLTLPYAPVAGCIAALAALTVGHAPSTGTRTPQVRWQFTTGAGLGIGFLQTMAIGGAVGGMLAHPWITASVVTVSYIASLFWFGRRV